MHRNALHLQRASAVAIIDRRLAEIAHNGDLQDPAARYEMEWDDLLDHRRALVEANETNSL